MHTIRTIIFDLGGVYFSDGAAIFQGILEERYGLDATTIQEVTMGSLGKDYRTGKVTPAQFWEAAVSAWNLNQSEVPTLQKLWLEGYEPNLGTIELIERLKKNGYELLFLSDNAPDRVEFLEKKYDFLRHFKAGVFSHMVGTKKPDPKMYETALSLTKSKPEECVYTDDKPHLLLPAAALGIHTIPFHSPLQVTEELRMLGVNA